MILRRAIEHVRTQNWTAIALDFVIVVVGIWVALMVGEWSQGRQERLDLARAERDINNEISEAYYYAYERRAIAPCRKVRYAELAALLLTPDPNWPGSLGPYGDGILTKHRVLPPALRSSVRPWESLAWDTELGKGTLDIMDPEKRRLLRGYFDSVKDAARLQEEIYKIESRLQVLSHPLEMTMGDRLRYYDVLAEADAQSALLELTAEQIMDQLEQGGLLVLGGEQRLALQESLKERSASVNEIYGDCVEPVELPLLQNAPAAAGDN